LEQDLNTVPGQSYQLSFWLRNTNSATPNYFRVWWDGFSMLDYTNFSSATWTQFQFIVIASGTATPLEFGFQNDPAYFGLDDVTVTPVNTTPVASILMGGSAAGASLTAVPALRTTKTVAPSTGSIPPPAITGCHLNADGTLTLNLSGTVGQTQILYGATELNGAWLPLTTNLLTTPGWQFTDSQAPANPQRYYRLGQSQ
ncbi:MAG TPA: hypothetical protein VF607_08150, partial [Verrucomicrobiae bacterium]